MRKKIKETILVTGAAGFIGSNLIKKLLNLGTYKVLAIDNFDDFYPKEIKISNLKPFMNEPEFTFKEGDILNTNILETFAENIDIIVHLAAKAGVRPSIEDPSRYQQVNEAGTLNLLEFAKNHKIKRFIFASSSSVYGINNNVPWSEDDKSSTPISPYAATKLSGEMMGHVYSYLFEINFIALRFFTVYGPGQRPDLAIHKFFNLIQGNNAINVFGDGSTFRDYTHIDDIIHGVIASIKYSILNKFDVINLGNNKTTKLIDLIELIEKIMDKKAKINFLPEQPGDVPRTFANISKAENLLNYTPEVEITDGLNSFYRWFLNK
jgi:UDP-glucuronate 4-epimerase